MHMTIELPAPHLVFDVVLQDGAITRVRQHGDPSAPLRLVLSHGSGFAIDGYLPFWQGLLEQFEVVLFDHRNHGWNAPSDPQRHHYSQLAHDTEVIHQGIVDHLGSKPSAGVFHSMAARAALKHAVDINWCWNALVLFDPPNFPPAGHLLYDHMLQHGQRLMAWAQNRQARFADPSELAAQFKRLRVHQNWVEGAHELMAQSVLRQNDAEGDWVLVCPGELEARMYRSNLTLDLWPQAEQLDGPVKLIAADPTIERPGVPALGNRKLAECNGFDYEAIPGSGHMLQLEQPEACRHAMLAFLAGLRLIPGLCN